MSDVRCNICGGELGFFKDQMSLHSPDHPSRFYCLDLNCENHNGIKKAALDVQVGGDWYKTLVIQPVEYCQKNKLNMIESGVVKYVTRHRAKNGREDIEKAIHLLQMLLEMEYPEEPKQTSFGVQYP